MTIPSIESYLAPRGADLPVNKVRWTPEPARAALLIHDMQDYFLRFYQRGEPPISSLLANVARIAEACRARGVPVFYTAQPPEQSREERGLLNDVWGPGITANPEGHTIVSELRPQPGDQLLTKYRYSAFHRTELLALLRERGRDQLLICGVYAHIGCLLTAADAFMNDVQPFLISDGLADFSAHYHKLALGYAAERCAVTLDSESLLATFAACSPSFVYASVAAALGVEALGEDEDLFELGLDSIRLMSLVEAFRGQGARVSFDELAECRSLREVSALVCSSTGGAR